MRDIVERLRREPGNEEREALRSGYIAQQMREAAAEIERLRKAPTYHDGLERAAQEIEIVCDRTDKSEFGTNLAAWVRGLPDDPALPHPESPRS